MLAGIAASGRRFAATPPRCHAGTDLLDRSPARQGPAHPEPEGISRRLKDNSIFWDEENAEGILQVRGLVLAGRWNATFAKITASLAEDRRLDWRWRSVDMTADRKAPAADPISTPQPSAVQATCNPAA